MSRSLAVLLGAGAGCLVGMQAPINSRLGQSVGDLQAAAFSFIAGTVVLVAIAALARGGLCQLAHINSVPWWALIGGLLGAVYVSVALVAVRTLGAGGITAAVISGNLAMAVAIDRFGLFGVPRQPIGATRMIGLVLLIVGVALVVRK